MDELMILLFCIPSVSLILGSVIWGYDLTKAFRERIDKLFRERAKVKSDTVANLNRVIRGIDV